MDREIKAYTRYVDRQLLARQVIFFVVVAVIIGIIINNVIDGVLGINLAIFGFALMTIIGIGLSRIFYILWHPEKKKVVFRLDTFGIILLILYLFIEYEREWVFKHWLSGDELNAFVLLVFGGLLLGRFIGTTMKINNILIERNKL